jgi:uncharacterized protein (DUF1778 family)
MARNTAAVETQISAFISKTTKDQVERYADAHGLKKGRLVEEALLHHLQALHELPADIIIPPRLVLTPASFGDVTARMEKPKKPTKALRELMAGKTAKRAF